MAYNKKNEFPKDLQDISAFCRVLSHPVRLYILLELSKTKHSFCGEIVNNIPLTQPTVSQHLKELTKLGLVKATQMGVNVSYSVNKKALAENQENMNEIIDKILKNLKKEKQAK